MAMNHVAIMRSSARMASHQRETDSQHEEQSSIINPSTDSGQNIESSIVSQMSVISLSSREGSSQSFEKNTSGRLEEESQYPLTSTKNVISSLPNIGTLADIEENVCSDLHQLEVLNKIEQSWHSISANLETVMNHLQDCSDQVSLMLDFSSRLISTFSIILNLSSTFTIYQVTEASTNCLQSLLDSIETSCDKVDGEVNALYHLMSKCDELTTKLSIASSFCDEIKTLRKSVETLENLQKSKPLMNWPS